MSLKQNIYKIKKEFITFKNDNSDFLALSNVVLLFINNKVNKFSRGLIRVKLKHIKAKFYVRSNNKIDIGTLRATFSHQFHNMPDSYNGIPKVIFDLGSNIGSTVVDYALKYPDSKIFGFEMDLDNFNLAKRNTLNFPNINLENCAIWYKNEIVKYDNSIREDGYSATSKKMEGMMEVEGKTIGQLMLDYNISDIDYLKMDIEGAEKEIFFKGDLNWLRRVKLLNVELHGFSDTEFELLATVLRDKGFQTQKHPKHWASIYAFK
jgi:FkbM family methyltransferase